MKLRKIIPALLIVTSATLNPLFAYGWQQADTTTSPPEIIPVSRITVSITELNSQLAAKWSEVMSDQQEQAVVTAVDTIIFRLNLLREDPRIDNIGRLNFRSLNDLAKDWSALQSALALKQSELSALVDRIETDRLFFNDRLEVWARTRVSAGGANVPASVIRQIEQTEISMNTLVDSLASDSEFLQEKLVAISRGLIFCNSVMTEVNSATNRVSTRVFELNQPPIWKLFTGSGADRLLEPQRDHIDDLVTDIKDFVSSGSLRMLLHLLFIILLSLSMGGLNRSIVSNIPKSEAREMVPVRKIISRPVSVAILLGFLSSYLFYGRMPEIVVLINTLIISLPVILLLTDLLSSEFKRLIITPVVALILIQLHSLGYSETLFSRLAIVAIIVAAISFFLGLAVTINRRRRVKFLELGRPAVYIAYAATVLLFVALVSEISGAVMMAEFITYAVIKSTSLVIFIYALRISLNSIIYILLYGKGIHLFNILAQYHEVIYRRTERLVGLVSKLLWILFTLKLFNIWDEAKVLFDWVFNTHLTVGTIEVSLGDFSIFIIILVLTIWISRLVRTVIEGEIAPRVKMKRGVPGALALLLRIAIITGGFLFAAGAAGFGMDKMTILLGALGVGIGFGLQNIFNNLVSGIILAFERPIQEGDIIEVGNLWGTVKEIGIRASTIFTFDGAEVIVPNGNLISNELINWTLTDRNRRVEVKVGVAYGTDPEKVLEILREVSSNNSEIMSEPAPLALFSGFGESSLDFRLLFWIAKADNRFVVQSGVHVAVNKALKKAGIEIPFPQRDIHIRSVDPEKTRW